MIVLNAYPFTSYLTYDENDLPVYDRAIDSEVFRKLMRQYFTDGVFAVPANSLSVAPSGNGLSVTVMPGAGNVRGVTGYYDSSGVLEIEPPGNTARFDAVVLRFDDRSEVRALVVDVVSGNGTVKPEPTRTESIYELILAYVDVRVNATQILSADIEDVRLNTALCGLVRTPIEVPDTDPYFEQIQAMIESLRRVIGGILDESEYMLKAVYDPESKSQNVFSKTLSLTAPVTGWSGAGPYVRTFTDLAGVNELTNGLLLLAQTADEEETEAAMDCRFRVTAQGEGSITVTAAEVPAIDVPLTLMIVG